ncbi:MAG: right-handed parallel beta-helix repeat-containing protein [bacterium]|nr:right-handed parallel beta-helix repeat-containing protein [bacterium]
MKKILIFTILLLITPALVSAKIDAIKKRCAPLTGISGQQITVSNVTELEDAVSQINQIGRDATVLLEDGIYNLNSQLYITADNVIFRSVSGERNNVVIQGDGMTGNVSHVFSVAGDHVTIADITIGEIANHAIQVHGESSINADDLFVHNVHFFNTGEQMLKGSSDYITGSDHGSVECSLFEYTSDFGPQYYIGGIDVHLGESWIVRDNTFKNIRSPENGYLAEHAVHFWSESKNTKVLRNKIVNCDRGIGFGLGKRGHQGGLISNNMIFNNGQGLNDDVGISLENVSNAKVYNNTIFFQGDYVNAIEYRFTSTSGVRIHNNLTNKLISSRDGGSGTIGRNFVSAKKDWFKKPVKGNLHLNRKIKKVVRKGKKLKAVKRDYDGEKRPTTNRPDIGADEI